MKFEIWAIERTKEKYLQEGENRYLDLLKYYNPVKIRVFRGVKNKSSLKSDQIKQQEYALISSHLDSAQGFLVLLDPDGKEYSSEQFASQLEKWMATGRKQVIFLIGGAYGFAPELYKRANASIALSRLTFTHQMVRLIFLEQLYRAMTILRNEKYHK